MSNSENGWGQRAETIAKDVLAVHAADVDEKGRWPEESIRALGAAGLLGLTVPQQYGGDGAGPRTFAQVNRTLARECASTAMIYMMHVCATQVIASAKEKLAGQAAILQDTAAGKHLSTLAFSEKGSRSHFWAPVSQAVDEGDAHRLSADKSWVTSADHADSYVVSTRAAGSDEPMASTLYWVAKESPGLYCNGRWNGLGMRGNASAPMRLDGVSIPSTNRLTADGEGFTCMLNVVLPWFQLGSAAVSVGLAQAATDATKQHLLAAKLEHLGQSLADLPNLRANLAKMQIQIDTQRAFLDHVARQMENPGPATLLAVLESKASANEVALEVTDLAMRTCGGAAFSKHLPIERSFRDARAGSVMAPTTDVLYDFIGKSLLDIPLF